MLSSSSSSLQRHQFPTSRASQTRFCTRSSTSNKRLARPYRVHSPATREQTRSASVAVIRRTTVSTPLRSQSRRPVGLAVRRFKSGAPLAHGGQQGCRAAETFLQKSSDKSKRYQGLVTRQDHFSSQPSARHCEDLLTYIKLQIPKEDNQRREQLNK